MAIAGGILRIVNRRWSKTEPEVRIFALRLAQVSVIIFKAWLCNHSFIKEYYEIAAILASV